MKVHYRNDRFLRLSFVGDSSTLQHKGLPIEPHQHKSENPGIM